MAALLIGWAFLPLLVTAVYAGHHGGSATGAFSSLVVEDQFQYFAWIRQSGEHIGIANLFDTGDPHHAFVLPPFLLSGALWRLGLPLPIAYHLWTVLGAVGLAAATAAYARRSLRSSPAWIAATALALVFGAPLMALFPWIHLAGEGGGDRLMAYVMSPLAALWGYAPRLISMAAMPAFLLTVEGVVDPARRRAGWSGRRYGIAATAFGMWTSWTHPWQGLIVLVIVVLAVAWDRLDRRNVALAVPLAATAAPLVYYAALAHFLSEWGRASQNVNYYSVADFLVVLGPFVALALVGIRRPGRDVHERMLLLWPVATLVAFVAPTGGRFETVAGLSIPLAVLCVRGWQRLRLPRIVAALAATAVAAGIVLPLAHDARRYVRDGSGTVWLHDGDRAAIHAMEESRAPGSVLADSHIAAATVAFTGRPMWAAHANWSPDYVRRATAMNAAVAGRLPRRTLQAIIRAAGAGFLFRDCSRRSPAALPPGPVARFGCATVVGLGG